MKKCLTIFCFIFFSFSGHSQSWDWVTKIQGDASDYIWDVVHDSENNYYVTGRVKGNATFGLGSSSQYVATLGPETDIFLAKFNEQSDLIWVRRMGDIAPDWGRALAVDSDNNIYITGDFVNMAVFGNDTIYGYNNGSMIAGTQARSGFIAKYDSDGMLIWVNEFHGGDRVRGHGIAVDSQGNSYITGVIQGLTDFGSVTIGEANLIINGFVAKYNPAGVCIWADYFDSPYGGHGHDIKLMDDERVLVTGYYKFQMVYDGQTITGVSPTWGDFFLMQIDSSGSFIWNAKGTGPYYIEGYNMAIDMNDNVYVVGHFANTMNLGDTVLTSLGVGGTTTEINDRYDSFLAKYDENGNRIWIRQLGSQYKTEVEGIAILDEKYIVVSGYTKDTIPIYNGVDKIVPSNGFDTGFIAVFDSAGNYHWHKKVISDGSPPMASYNNIIGNTAYTVDVDNKNNIIVAGLFGDTAYWDATMVEAFGLSEDAFIAKIFPPLEPSISFNQFCLNDTLLFFGSQFGSPITYSWQVENNSIYTSSFDSLMVLGTIASYDSITYIVSNGYETDTATISFLLNPAPILDLGTNYSTCQLSDTLNAGSAGQMYDWGAGAVLNDSTLIIYLSGTYSVVISDANGCSSADSIDIVLND